MQLRIIALRLFFLFADDESAHFIHDLVVIDA